MLPQSAKDLPTLQRSASKFAADRTPAVARGPRALRDSLPACFCSPASVFLPKFLEIPSFDTTVRRRPDRSRPPQVGAAAHTCTAAADRTAPAKTFRAPRSLCLSLPRLSSATRFACTLPPRRRRSLRRNQGGGGGLSRLCRGIISPGGVRGSAPRALA